MKTSNSIATTILSVLVALTVGVMMGCVPSSTTPPPTEKTPQASNSANWFEESLTADELAKFQELPVEFQDALRDEAYETSNDTAREYLRDLPDVVSPITEILPSETLSKFQELGARQQRIVLLGYNEAFKARPGQDPSKIPPPSSMLAGMVDLAHKMEFGDARTFLPPMTETLSQEALAKLDSVESRMSRAFKLIWHNRKVDLNDVDGVVQKLEVALLAAPIRLPEITNIGLSIHSTELIAEVPAAKRLVEEWLAAEIIQSKDWHTNVASSIDRLLVQFRTPEDKEALSHLYIPADSGVSSIVCQLGPSAGVWPEWTLPVPFRNVSPNSLMAMWPSHNEVLSQEALAKLDSLDSGLRERLEDEWYGTGPLPMEARKMACLALEWDAKLHEGTFGTYNKK